MSEKLCALRKIGGGMSEKVLWTNPSPTSNFIAQTITISQSITDFKWLKVVFRASTTDSNELSIYATVDDFIATQSELIFNNLISPCGAYNSALYTRRVAYASATTLSVSLAQGITSTSQINNILIPIKIIGMR